MAKLFVSEAAWRCADRCVQAFGGRGYMRSNVAERFLRELRVDRIWEGTSEIQRLIVARGLERRGVGAHPALGRGPRRPDPAPLLRPRSVAVVGASERAGSYGDTVLRNLAAGFEGGLGDQPEARRVHGRPCVPSLGGSAGAGRRGRGRDSGGGGARSSPKRWSAVAVARSSFPPASARRRPADAGTGADRGRAAGGLPLCGPNCNGVVSVGSRSPLWGDSVRARPGRVALITQSGNIAVNALGLRRGIGFHTVVSAGNQAVIAAADWIEAVAALEGVRSIALFLEEDGDGAELARALGLLRRARDRGRGPEGRVLAAGARRRGPTPAPSPATSGSFAR